MKKCTKCGEEKEFSNCKSRKDGLNVWCKACIKEWRKDNQKKNILILNQPTTKVCPKCTVEKSSNDFYKATGMKDGLTSWCKECQKAANKQFTVDSGISKTGKACRENNKYRTQCNNARWVNYLIRSDKLDAPTEFTCAMDGCSNQSLEYHHLKYDGRNTDDPFSIITPLCRDCHDLFHIRQREGIDLTNKILTQIELEFNRGKPPYIKFLKEKT